MNLIVFNILILIAIFIAVIVGIYNENRRQRERFLILEENERQLSILKETEGAIVAALKEYEAYVIRGEAMVQKFEKLLHE